jgi:hypothetical protein
VRAYDPATRDVAVLLDDGRRVQVPGAAVDARLRLLRPGQRVRLRREGDAVVALGHPGLPPTGPDARCSPPGSTMAP